ncbi:MAG: xanthine dehydrogenase accessory protein XdhC [Burkholderiales bacterium 35-55-47]|uniref:xanthine dehydrogenase accessory protein XdhC n=1 Tax=Limnohabitans sp. TaxID=1907725 RepID=UPI000BDD76CF|nr:xanthine dehydrogenase accessory protein XdhC [Limnohabitans sp.]OYY20049.1 MAG: xanthine dehydrogenase accessory protein XdhC [Burkholderiales bacterium 35-55-47]OYZ74341.1 MAG: xanthine dehydrogenase accessory protein XdhC [Burkholderiales bacterium 24-55-52]OZB01768.1 MAG: xanthine dehydrogenase accessory protein XdhC [Burkholderiales bacterium 39-55-53]HQR86276.1 xanthine dehydrogenase accessory protein XdhC [Limnohabitans sp.]HQS25807.1 xanthine dehydrogenase accessory protein XdhC [Li
MPRHTAELLNQLQHADGVLVSVDSVQGSGPREVGAWMAVFPQTLVNTIGGGHLEFQAITEARALMARPVSENAASTATHEDNALTTRYALGPALGQCCGGVVHLKFERISAADAPALKQRLLANGQPLALFGGGHVGRALVNVLSTLPYNVQWIDSRDEIFPAHLPPNVVCEHSDPVHAAVADLPSGASVLVMSFSHAEDLDVVAACLKRQRLHGDLKFVGLIGSNTKWATFQHRLEAKGFTAEELAFITCPIGVSGITGKEPEVIAVSVAAQLLQLEA